MSVVVRRVPVQEIVPLRHAVLRPGRPVTASVYAEDEEAVHVAAYDDTALVGCASVFPQPWPDEPAAWRLRGMAVDPSRQRTGVGRLVLAAAVEAVTEAGAPLLWANARTTALPFYESLGWTVAGEEFLTPDTGLPHKPITFRPSDVPSPLP